MSDNFGSLEAIGEEFKKADDIENESLFVKGRIVNSAVKQGWNIDECVGYCAAMTQQDKRTVYRYYSVARTFPNRMYGLRHEMHAIAADTIDYRKDMTAAELLEAQENALGWLQIASKEQYSTRALRAAIKAVGGRVDEKPIVLLDGVEATIIGMTLNGNEMVLKFKEESSLTGIKMGVLLNEEKVKVTLVLVAPTEAKVIV